MTSVTPWKRLNSRMIWVDVVRSLLSLMPAALAIGVFRIEPTFSVLWPVAFIAVFGTWGAVRDALRWVFTRYRVTDDYVERRTGIFVKHYRTIQRDRIRSMDLQAKLRHRLAGLRIINIGAGQQTAANESALELDALSKRDAEALRNLLLYADETHAESINDGREVLARFRPHWVFYNCVGIGIYFYTLAVVGTLYFLFSTFNIDVFDSTIGWALDNGAGGLTIALVGFAGATVVGAVGMALYFFTRQWDLELARIQGETGEYLRTRRGLFKTVEVNREEARFRGVSVFEPLLWRWIRMADVHIITTGLSLWSGEQPAALLPRVPRSTAFIVARQVIDKDSNPLDVSLARHPRRALGRRLWWATAVALVVTGILAWLSIQGLFSSVWIWAGLIVWILALMCAIVAFRSLGHALNGSYLVVRAGLL